MKNLHLIIAVLGIFIFSSCSQYKFVSAKKSYPKDAITKTKKQPAKVANARKQHIEKVASIETADMKVNSKPMVNPKLKDQMVTAETSEMPIRPIEATPKYDYTKKAPDNKPFIKKANSSKANKKQMRKELKHVLKSNYASSSEETLLLVIVAFFIPFLAVGLYDGITTRFWLSLVLTILLWLPGFIYALIVILE